MTTISSSLGSSVVDDDDIEMPSEDFVSPSKARVAEAEREDEICNEKRRKKFYDRQFEKPPTMVEEIFQCYVC